MTKSSPHDHLFPRKVPCAHCTFSVTATSLHEMATTIKTGSVCSGCRLWVCSRCSGGTGIDDVPAAHLLN